jgi:chemotaxis protein MotB
MENQRLPASTGELAVQGASAVQVQRDLEHIGHDLQNRLSTQIEQQTVSIRLSRNGLIVSLREAGFFDSGEATPRPETASTLQQVAESLTNSHYDVRVEGHTDNVPIHNSDFDSNWELSSARATRIARMLLQTPVLTPQQISAAGYAEYHPVASNDAAEGRARNRRVDLVVMPRVVLDFSREDTEDNSAWRKITDP